jgi:hypothetical protein
MLLYIGSAAKRLQRIGDCLARKQELQLRHSERGVSTA